MAVCLFLLNFLIVPLKASAEEVRSGVFMPSYEDLQLVENFVTLGPMIQSGEFKKALGRMERKMDSIRQETGVLFHQSEESVLPETNSGKKIRDFLAQHLFSDSGELIFYGDRFYFVKSIYRVALFLSLSSKQFDKAIFYHTMLWSSGQSETSETLHLFQILLRQDRSRAVRFLERLSAKPTQWGFLILSRTINNLLLPCGQE